MNQDAHNEAQAPSSRPLSPHLQVYRPQITSILSITHRATGVALAGGVALFVLWLAALAWGPDAFGFVHGLVASEIGRTLLLGVTFALFYHLLNGIRHLAWDAGFGFEMGTLRFSGILVVVASVVLTLSAFACGYSVIGKGIF